MKRILVINLGMKSVRSIVFDSEGRKLASSSLPIETYLCKECVTQDPDEWWEKASVVVRESIIDLDKDDIDYITVTSSSSCLVCVNDEGQSIYKSIMVSDRRATSEAKLIAEHPLYIAWNGGIGGICDTSLMLPKILWVKDNEPILFKQTYKYLAPNDYFIHRMTGQYVTDIFNAHKLFYDPNSMKYPEELLQELGISVSTLPEVREPGMEIGTITETAAKELGLSQKTKVILSSYDAICSFFGSGALNEGEASDVSGTVTVFRTPIFGEKDYRSDKLFSMPYVSKKMRIVGGSNNLGGGLIEWVKQCYYTNESSPYEIMEKDALDAQLGAGGLIFLPYLLGERAPIWNSDARGVFFGLERSHTRKEMTRAVFESTGFIDMDMIHALEEAGIKIGSIRISGGLARLNLVSQIKADITGREINVLSEFETTSSGAAMMALTGCGVFENYNKAAEVFATIRMTIHPDQDNHRKYMRLYHLYKDAYQSMSELFIKRMDIVKDLYPAHQVKVENL